MGIFFTWIIASIVVGILGSDRKIGGFEAFLISLFLSPLVGLIFVLSSTKKSTLAFQKKMLEAQSTKSHSTEETKKDEISFLSKQFKEGKLSEEEYLTLLKKLGGL